MVNNARAIGHIPIEQFVWSLMNVLARYLRRPAMILRYITIDPPDYCRPGLA